MNNYTPQSNQPSNSDDANVLRQVLESVRGIYPATPAFEPIPIDDEDVIQYRIS